MRLTADEADTAYHGAPARDMHMYMFSCVKQGFCFNVQTFSNTHNAFQTPTHT